MLIMRKRSYNMKVQTDNAEHKNDNRFRTVSMGQELKQQG